MAHTEGNEEQTNVPVPDPDVKHPEWEASNKDWKFQQMHYDSRKLMKKVKSRARLLARRWDEEGYKVRYRTVDEERNIFRKERNIPINFKFQHDHDYLPQLHIEKDKTQYLSRVQNADYTNHMRRIIQTCVGMLSKTNDDRSWQEDEEAEGLLNVPGVVVGENSPINVQEQMMKNADGNGTGWMSKLDEIAEKILIYDKLYLIKDQTKDGHAKINIIQPHRVTNWERDENGDLSVVEVKNEKSVGGIGEEYEEVTEYIVYTKQGFQKFQKQVDGTEMVPVGDFRPYEYYKTPSRDERRLPIVEINSDLDRFGYELAQKTNRIFRMETLRDSRLYTSAGNKMKVDSGDDAFREIEKSLQEGGELLQGDAEYINPSTDPVKISSETVEKKVEDLYTTFFLSYTDSASIRTATEIRADYRKGIASILTMLQETLEDAENEMFDLIEQHYYEDREDLWGQAQVMRSNNVEPSDPERYLNFVNQMFMALPRSLPSTIMSRIVKKGLDFIDINYDDEEVEEWAEETTLIEDSGSASNAALSEVRERLNGNDNNGES